MQNGHFEQIIRELTGSINGQYPRPWMTDLANPKDTKVFLVGRNWGVTYSEADIANHDRFMDAHFNRNGESCRALYDEITGGRPTKTKQNHDVLLRLLRENGVCEILETNVICYGTPLSSDLNSPEHRGGRERGKEIFLAVQQHIRPRVIISHGSGTARDLASAFRVDLPEPQYRLHKPQAVSIPGEQMPTVFVIPSLALPAFNQWKTWSLDYLKLLAVEVSKALAL